MKFFGLIFSMYLLLLSCAVCTDNDDCCKNDNKVTTVAAVTHNKVPQQENEACTPFCCCSCCAASVYVQPIAKYRATFTSSLLLYAAYTASYSFTNHASIWQPPKLS